MSFSTVLFDQYQIADRVRELSYELDKVPISHVVVVMNGALHFASQLLLQLRRDVSVSLIQVRTYVGKSPVNPPKAIDQIGLRDLSGHDVLVIEDIVDTGATIKYLRKQLLHSGARTVRTISLLQRRGSAEQANHIGFLLEDNAFVVGYGLDLDGKYRHYPFIGVLS
jgi:hypoxanthine phosphoribosyltransferase